MALWHISKMSDYKFRVNAKNYCLTYSNTGQQSRTDNVGHGGTGILSDGIEHTADTPFITAESTANAIISLLANVHRPWRYLVVAREKHEDGSPHYHAGICLETRWNLRDNRVFDIGGVHANIQAARDVTKWITYVKKDNDFVEFGECPTNKSNKDRLESSELIAMAKELQLADFLAYCSVHKYTYGKDIWQMVHEDTSMTLVDGQQFEGEIKKEFELLMSNVSWNNNLTLLLVGDSGIGKTTWAKRIIPKPALMVTHIDDLRKFKAGYHKSILFDDVSIHHMPETAQIHLVDYDNPRSIHCRYGTARIPAGIVKIITCNTIPVSYSIEAIKRRTQLLSCTQISMGSIHATKINFI